MKKYKRVLLIGCIALSLSTIANANFTGFSVDLITGFSHNKIKYTDYVDTVSSSHNSAILQVGAEYNFLVYENILFGMGATYTFNKADAGRIHYSDSSADYSVS